ncbi:MAG: 50S ribosomal protein L18 [Candidatus Cloacimonetes bacterium]|jgi:large subunit ribosomal protein L18|nr:50S ribosomal protein L18 [Candidatus Cloacimonadota bacterium]MCB5288067.1 50S ribosomal protein L18 [Candidatus Cloacimonadota bacterium]MCK9185456.1 50S ribosomal protein L18 [Candidatus Cloacimonadota bacterium]MCK9583878.1 50S ribosomal protein L18 [Candidatus Cloacimonadota bacterium]MDY0230390.1 50S ribosomal protein L18 [Candidatus Cloacimonadaceae bacterium]
MIKSNTKIKNDLRKRRRAAIRKHLSGSSERPRLAVFRSNKNIYAQIIDDSKGVTLAAMSSKAKDFAAGEAKTKTEISHVVGLMLGKKALEAGIVAVAFDRAGYKYHGRVKALAEGARKAGLDF